MSETGHGTLPESEIELGPLLQDKVVIVTGARRGIGAAIAEAAAAAGARVSLFATRPSDETAARIVAAGGEEPLVVSGDIASIADVTRLHEETAAKFGRVDVLVNNAAKLHVGPFLEISEEKFSRVLHVNVMGVFLAGKTVAKGMVERGDGGVIINIGSDLAVRGADGYAAYSASKGAVLQLTKTMAIELGKHGIRVVMLSPAVTETDMAAPALRNEETRRELLEKGVLGTINSPVDVAHAAVFLASPAARTVTGCNWPIDNGVLAK